MVHAFTAFAQLACLSAFGAGVYWLNQQAPKKVSQRVFKLSWLLPTVGAGLLFFWLASTALINVPTRLQTTNASLITAHDGIRATCQNHLENLRFDDAYTTISVRTKTSELVGEHARKMKEAKQHKSSLARMLQPILNSLLFHTGVTIVFVPALLRLLLLLWRIQQQGANANDPKFVESVRREWGVFLPIMNVVTLLSLCVSPTFYFFIEPGRASRCVYSSGHWYTFTCTVLTFALVLTHLYRNRDYCKSCMRLLNAYFVWLVLYLAMSLMVLQTTQTFFHDSIEARDGMRQALPAFALFMLILIAFQFITRNKRDITEDITAAKQGKQIKQEDGEDEEEEQETTTKKPASTTKPAARTSNKISSPAHDEADEDEQPKPRSSSRKKAAGAASSSSSLPKSPSEASFEFVEPEVEPIPAAHAVVPSAVPNAPPSAPPMAPPPPTAPAAPSSSSSSAGRADIKITKSAAKAKPAAAAAAPDTDALLREIQSGKRLKKVTGGSASASSKPKPPPANDLMAQLRAQLAAVRVGVDGEKDEGAEADW